jgi:hypothetical protein
MDKERSEEIGRVVALIERLSEAYQMLTNADRQVPSWHIEEVKEAVGRLAKLIAP